KELTSDTYREDVVSIEISEDLYERFISSEFNFNQINDEQRLERLREFGNNKSKKSIVIKLTEEFKEFLIKILADKVAIIPQSLIPVKFVTPNIQKSRSNHQSIPKMITTAIEKLKDRKGSSLQAIEKYIVEKYKLDGDKLALFLKEIIFIKKYLKTTVSTDIVKQTTGKGASESFKFSITKSKDVKT
uniref:uncharacterized protein LOC127072370 n=1 Tax=Vespula vulgaris TaxID=7454 RepID=UPI00223B9EF5